MREEHMQFVQSLYHATVGFGASPEGGVRGSTLALHCRHALYNGAVEHQRSEHPGGSLRT